MSYRPCPNHNVPEWKLIVNQLGDEREAYRVFMAHNYTIPFAVGLTEFKKMLGLTSGKYSTLQQIKINKRIRLFNQKYGTSHYIKYSKYGTGEVSTAEVKFNYLPVNKQAQAERNARRKMEGYVGLEDAESFETVEQPDNTKQDVFGLDQEHELGNVNEEGDFVAPSYFPNSGTGKKLGPKFQEVMKSKQQDLKILYQDLEKLRTAKKQTDNIEKRSSLTNIITKTEEKIESVKEAIVKIENLNQLENIIPYAEEDMKTLDRIFSKTNPTSTDLQIASRLIKMWQTASDFSGNQPHIFYDPDELEGKDDSLKTVTDKFLEWGRKADGYNAKLIFHQERLIEQDVQETFGKDIKIDYNKPWKDVNALIANVLDISETDNIFLQVTHRWVGEANHAAKLELDKINEKIDELVKKTGLTSFEIFAQTFGNKDSRKTGDMVFRWSQEFFEWERKIRGKRSAILEKYKDDVERRVAANREYIEELRKNTVVFDPRILFYDAELHTDAAPTQEKMDNHIKMLKDILGEKGYNQYYESNKRKIEEFKSERASYISMIEAEYGENQAVVENAIAGYEMRESPYYFAEVMEKGYDRVTYNGQHAHPSNKYTYSIPKKFVNSRETGFYDNKFEQIEANESHLELYNYMFDLMQTLKLYLPNERVSFMHVNSIPFLKKKLYETIHDGGVIAGFTHMKDQLAESVRTDDLATTTNDPDKKDIQIQHLQNIQSRVASYVELKYVEYKTQNADEPSADVISEWTKDATDLIVSQEKSFDLDRVMKAFAATAVTYKHRSLIEDQIRNVSAIIDRAVQMKNNAAGDPVFDKYGNQYASVGLKNLKQMYENFLDVAYWGYPSNKPEGQLESRVLTSKEKEIKKSLEEGLENIKTLLETHVISEAEAVGREKVFQDQLDVLGGVKTMSKYGDMLLHYIQLKGMGWNLIAGIGNLGFGTIANLMEASDGRNFSPRSFWKAQALVLNSAGRNFTFNMWDGIDGNAKKIRVLMNYYDTLKQSKEELYKPSHTSLFRRVGEKFEWINPYSIQSRTEYMNQAPIMIAMMMDTKVKVKIGEEESEMSLWDAYNVDGTLKEGVVLSDKKTYDTKAAMDKVIKITHGNYDPNSPIAIKRIFIGRALSQFRTWAYEGFSERFRGDIKDYQLKNIQTGENFVKRRGRYKSYVHYFQVHNQMMGVGGVFSLTYQLLRKMSGFKTQFDADVTEGGVFDETDAANLRKNMTEIVLYGMLTAMMLLLKGDVDDEENKKKRAAYIYMINQIGRLNTDIAFYTNPIAFEKLTRNAIPAFTLVVDAAKVFDDAAILLGGGEDILQSGPNKGEGRTWRDFKKLIPGPVQLQKLTNMSSMIYNNKPNPAQ